MKSRKTGNGVVVALCGALSLAATALADMPEIRFASQAPFKDGKRVEAVWKAADTLTRFVIPKNLDVATYETEAQLLFDDKNLYVTFKGFVDPKVPVRDKPEHGVEGSNNFEIFLQGDPSKLSYLHVIADEFARIHTDINKAPRRSLGYRRPSSAARTTGAATLRSRWTGYRLPRLPMSPRCAWA